MLLSYLNDEKLKKRFIEELNWHKKQDAIMQGTYGEVTEDGWKGCAVACSVRSLDKIKDVELGVEYNAHERYESELGIPEWLARLEDTIFEGLPTEDAMKWPLQFAKAIPVGVDLEPIKWKFGAYLMRENINRVLALDISDDLKKQVVGAIRGVLAVHEKALITGEWDESAAQSAAQSAAESARSAQSAAESAWSAWSAARSAWSARSAAESARSARSAQSAAESARSAAESAWSAWSAWSARSARSAQSAWSAAESARSARSAQSAAESARSAAESAAYQKQAKELIRLLKESK